MGALDLNWVWTHPKMFGNPDALLLDSNTVVFIDGCFWHGCPKHGHTPKSRKAFWSAKIARNKARDRCCTKKLGLTGYKVVRIWECQIMSKRKCRCKGLCLICK